MVEHQHRSAIFCSLSERHRQNRASKISFQTIYILHFHRATISIAIDVHIVAILYWKTWVSPHPIIIFCLPLLLTA